MTWLMGGVLLLSGLFSAFGQTVSVADVNASFPAPLYKLFGRAGLYQGEIRASTWFAGQANNIAGTAFYFNGEVVSITKDKTALHITLTGTSGTASSRRPDSLFLIFQNGKVSASGAFTLAPTSPTSGRMIINVNAVSTTQTKASK